MNQTHDLTGAVLAKRYRLVRALGRGGMGVVYEAVQEDLGRTVAIKILAPHLDDPSSLERFRREAKVAAGLGHPHIVQVTDLHADGPDPPFLVMELLKGASLGTVVRQRGALDGIRAATIAVQVLSALGAAHRAHVIHRDIKPENLFLVDHTGAGDFAKVLDFGIARPLDAAPVTSTGAIIGTLAYMAPEQARGDLLLDGRADLYALAGTLYFMLAGRKPFEGETAATLLAKVLSEPPPRLSSVRPNVDAELEAIVHRGLEKESAKRFANADEMKQKLEAWLAVRGVSMPAPAPMTTTQMASRPPPPAHAPNAPTAPGSDPQAQSRLPSIPTPAPSYPPAGHRSYPPGSPSYPPQGHPSGPPIHPSYRPSPIDSTLPSPPVAPTASGGGSGGIIIAVVGIVVLVGAFLLVGGAALFIVYARSAGDENQADASVAVGTPSTTPGLPTTVTATATGTQPSIPGARTGPRPSVIPPTPTVPPTPPPAGNGRDGRSLLTGPCKKASDCRYAEYCNDTTGLCYCAIPGKRCGALEGGCTDTSARENCGDCGKHCAEGERCTSRSVNLKRQTTCELCPAGETLCGNKCLTKQEFVTDSFNCGRCGNRCDGRCENSVCVAR